MLQKGFMPPECPSEDKRIPHIDFQKIFTTLSESGPPTQQEDFGDQQKPSQSAVDKRKPAKLVRGVRLTYTDQANILFVVTTFAGGLFCAFYFFDRSDLSYRKAFGPREFLYPRPRAEAQNSRMDTFRRADEHMPPSGLNSGRLPGRDVNPFGRNFSLLNSSPSSALASNGANVSPAGSGPNSGSPLAALNRTAPGGDALSQALHQGAADMDRASKLDAHRTVIVMRTGPNAATKTGQRLSGRAKRTTQRALRTGAKLSSRGHALTMRGRGQRNSQHRSRVNNATRNRGMFAGRQSVDHHAGLRAFNSMRNAFSNPSRGLGAERNHGGRGGGHGGRGGRGGGGAQ
jgi:hypothetical protein